jgi:hypothetical protein
MKFFRGEKEKHIAEQIIRSCRVAAKQLRNNFKTASKQLQSCFKTVLKLFQSCRKTCGANHYFSDQRSCSQLK